MPTPKEQEAIDNLNRKKAERQAAKKQKSETVYFPGNVIMYPAPPKSGK